MSERKDLSRDTRNELRELIHRGIFKAAPMFAASKMANFEQDIYDEILDRAADEILAWLARHDREVAAKAWGEGYVGGALHGLGPLDLENPYREGGEE